ncbi:MAG: glycosyltransferase family 39 protein [Chloroflexi bacterium]|nr:glycosyltransferase family 39 protein [Chloroflexota bacterium]
MLPDDRAKPRLDETDGTESSSDPARRRSSPHENEPESANTAEGFTETRIEDLTLAELFGRFIRSPRVTWRRARMAIAGAESVLAPKVSAGPQVQVDPEQRDALRPSIPRMAGALRQAQGLQLLFFTLAIVSAVIGTNALLGPDGISRSAENTLEVGAPFLRMGFLIWLIGEVSGNYNQLRSWWRRMSRLDRVRWSARIVPVATGLTSLQALSDSMVAPKEQSFEFLLIAAGRLIASLLLWHLVDFVAWRIKARLSATPATKSETSPLSVLPTRWPGLNSLRDLISTRRIGLMAFSGLASSVLWMNTSGNRIEPPFIVLWIVSAFAWAMVFAPANWNAFDWITARIDCFRRIDWRGNRWVIVAFALIMVLGISFRFTRLDSVPREMTSDHVEKIQDAYRVATGDYKIFFPNNGGREPVQMYLLSMLSTVPGFGFDFYTLKFLAVVESALTLPLLFWMGLELLGDDRPRFKKVVALLLMALVASSYWHVIVSRQGLRIPLTPAVTALLLVYLARAMRRNRRSDYVKAALVLGFGLYTYQAVRMLPVLIVIGVVFAIWMRAVTWRQKLLYLVHLAILVFVSLMVFLPMLHFWLDFPNSFWMRTSTRLLGDHLAYATADDALEALRSNLPVLMHNIRNALLMYNWKGDIGWFNGAPEHPVMDTWTGAFLILGAAAWLARMIKSRDPVLWFMPVVVFVMLMPTALSLAHPEANPSNSRALGTVPVVYLFAALPVAMMAVRLKGLINGGRGLIVAIVFGVGVVLMANHQNSATYFDRYAKAYLSPSFPHSEAGRIVYGFATSDGAIGNVWSLGFPYWWDYRALGIEAGYPLWPNDMYPLENLPHILRNALQRMGQFRLDPNRDLLFIFNPADEQAWQRLRDWFPQGRATTVQSYHPEDQFVLYRVPRLGEEGWAAFLAGNGNHR